MTKTQAIEETVKSIVTAMGFEFVGMEFLSQGRYSTLRIYVDQSGGITLDECSKLSEQIGAVLDVEELVAGEYHLEVSSPGLDRPLFTLEHYRQFVDCEVSVRLKMPLDGQRHFKGVIKEIKNEVVVLRVGEEEISLPFDSIAKAHLVYQW